MNIITSNHDKQVINSVLQAFRDGRPSHLDRILLANPSTDVFSVLIDENITSRLFQESSFEKWLLNIDVWLDYLYDARNNLSIEQQVLWTIWDFFSSNLIRNLRAARITAGIPITGGVLSFVAHLSKCLVVQYNFAASWPQLHPVAIIDQPKSAFDVWAAVDQADQSAKNSLKNILASGHKLVDHRGTLVHVDRRNESTVFGPSIDTLLMAEILAQKLYGPEASQGVSKDDKPKVVMEVGSGNGLISVELANYLESVEEVVCLDINFSAVACTAKNLDIVSGIPGSFRPIKRILINSEFNPELLPRRFDLIVCNPPYIPLPSNMDYEDKATPDYFKAVAGLDLMTSLLKALPQLLTPTGHLLLLTSTVCIEEVQSLIYDSLNVEYVLGPEGFRVMFDVEAVLNRPEWLELLRSGNRVFAEGNTYYHDLHPLWISLKAQPK